MTPLRATSCLAAAAAMVFLLAVPAAAQGVSLDFGEGAGLTERAVQIILLITSLSLAPSILVMVTSFVRIVVVLSLLRTAFGTPQAPPQAVVVSLALFLTAFVMAPVFETAYSQGVQPLIDEQIEVSDAFDRAAEPFHAFMAANVREKDLALFVDLAERPQPRPDGEVSMRELIPAFVISELRRAFEIGFLLFIPFVVIDMVVASVLMSMGMMMLPPVLVSLPFKLIFFVLVDGWNLVAGSLVNSFSG